MKRILIVGSWRTTHVRRFLRILNSEKEGLIIDSFDLSFDDNQGNECSVDHVFRVKASIFARKLYSIRKIGAFLLIKRMEHIFEEIVSSTHYDLVNIHFLPINAEKYVKIAHQYKTKVMLTPLGSDVLRVKSIFLPSLQRAFNSCDYVSANTLTGFCDRVKELFSVSEEKIVNLGYGSETITSIVEMNDNFTREDLCNKLNIPYSQYYICCGYTASLAQRHGVMIEAIAKSKDLLPANSRLIIPLSYGPAKKQLKQTLSLMCEQYKLPFTILSDYLTTEQVACIRYVSDLFIHIQPTDAYNASLQEFLLTGTEVINGSWLPYPSLEAHGAPYHVLSKLEDLPDMVSKILRGAINKPMLSKEAKDEIIGNAWSVKIQQWRSFYKSL